MSHPSHHQGGSCIGKVIHSFFHLKSLIQGNRDSSPIPVLKSSWPGKSQEVDDTERRLTNQKRKVIKSSPDTKEAYDKSQYPVYLILLK